MTDEEAALLAELKAISNNSASAKRFDDNDGESNDGNDITATKMSSNNTSPTNATTKS